MNNAGMPRIGAQPQRTHVQLGAGDTIEKRCACGGELFDIAYRYRILPRINPKNPTGMDQPIKVEVFMCRACGIELKG